MSTVDLESGGAPLTVLGEEETMFRDAVREFAETEVRPRVHQMDEAQKMDPALIPQFFELGLMAIEVPEEFGGTGSSFFTAALVVEELSRVDASVGVLVDVQNTLVNNAFLRWGSEELKAKYLPVLAAEKVGAYALSEAGSGSDAFALATRAVEADGGWRLTGQKLWITNGAEAEIFIVFANVNPEAGYKGITAFIVEKEFDGFSVGKKEDKLGIRASSTTELVLRTSSCRPRTCSARSGRATRRDRDAQRGPHRHRRADDRDRAGLPGRHGEVRAGARAVRPRHRRVPGRAVPDRADGRRPRGRAPHGLQRRPPQGRRQAVPAGSRDGQALQLQVAQRIASEAVDLFGGYGFTREYPVEKFYRDSKIGSIYEGTSNMQLQTIAKNLLR
jgi:alkylation response protein AidB-like acyl-CoA dehydrogenase